MAVSVINNGDKLDKFENKCPHCGTELSYFRKDVLSHARWPNGFIYCRKCKNPIGHEEANLKMSGKEYRDSLPPGTIDTYREQVKIFKILYAIFLPVGLVTMIGGTLAFASIAANNPEIRDTSLALMILCFFVGLALLITSGIFQKMKNNRDPYIVK